MTELEEAIMGKTSGKPQQEIPDQITLPELPKESTGEETLLSGAQEQIPEALPEELQESAEAVQRMTEEIRRENEKLEQRFAKPQEKSVRRSSPRRRYVYVGTFSAALSLIVMGIAMTVSLFSPAGIVGAFKIAPIMLVFLGIETAAAVVIGKNVRLRFSLKSIILTFSLIAVTFVMSLISIGNTVTDGEHVYAEERLRNMLLQEIRREVSSVNIRDADAQVLLYGENVEAYRTPADLGESDIINLRFSFSHLQGSVLEFSEECREIMDLLARPPFSGYKLGEVTFVSDDGGNRYSLTLNWLYQSELETAEIVPLVGYFGEDVEADIADLTDEQ